ncbi:DUF7336 domain-containing protein [Streptomyces avermitilis]|uniref:DUF7336 domain-containing protein n=1 Tax=Streptomyces avermitilis TaxID=33903 RepID=UPI00382EA50B
MTNVYIVAESGGYDGDYEVLDVFTSREGAEEYIRDLAPFCSGAEIHEMPLRSAGYKRPCVVTRRTRLGIVTGLPCPDQPVDIVRPTVAGEDVEPYVVVQLRYGAWEVRTRGEESQVSAVHDKAVAAKQAEIRAAQ